MLGDAAFRIITRRAAALVLAPEHFAKHAAHTALWHHGHGHGLIGRSATASTGGPLPTGGPATPLHLLSLHFLQRLGHLEEALEDGAERTEYTPNLRGNLLRALPAISLRAATEHAAKHAAAAAAAAKGKWQNTLQILQGQRAVVVERLGELNASISTSAAAAAAGSSKKAARVVVRSLLASRLYFLRWPVYITVYKKGHTV